MRKNIAPIVIGTAVLVMAFAGAMPAQARGNGQGQPVMSAYAVDTQPANLGTSNPAPKPKAKKPAKKKVVKPKKPAAKKPTVKKSPKPAAKKTTAKKTAPKTDLSTTAEDVSPADLSAAGGPVDGQTADPTAADPASQTVTASDDSAGAQDDLPQASPEPKSKRTAIGLTIAGLAGASGLGLIYLLKKFFWP